MRITFNLQDTRVEYSTPVSYVTFNSSYIYQVFENIKWISSHKQLSSFQCAHKEGARLKANYIKLDNILSRIFLLADPTSWGKWCFCHLEAPSCPPDLHLPDFASLSQARPADHQPYKLNQGKGWWPREVKEIWLTRHVSWVTRREEQIIYLLYIIWPIKRIKNDFNFETQNGKWVRVKRWWQFYTLNTFRRHLFVFLSEK